MKLQQKLKVILLIYKDKKAMYQLARRFFDNTKSCISVNGPPTTKHPVISWDDLPLHPCLFGKAQTLKGAGYNCPKGTKCKANPTFTSTEDYNNKLTGQNLLITKTVDGKEYEILASISFENPEDSEIDCRYSAFSSASKIKLTSGKTKTISLKKVFSDKSRKVAVKGKIISFDKKTVVLAITGGKEVKVPRSSISECHKLKPDYKLTLGKKTKAYIPLPLWNKWIQEAVREHEQKQTKQAIKTACDDFSWPRGVTACEIILHAYVYLKKKIRKAF